MSRVGKCFIFLWVDDLLIFSEKELLQPLVDIMLATFDGRDLKEQHHVIGVEVKRDRKAKTLSSSHKRMITELFDRNDMNGCRCSPTPLVPTDHQLAAQHVMRYLQSTIDVVLTFNG